MSKRDDAAHPDRHGRPVRVDDEALGQGDDRLAVDDRAGPQLSPRCRVPSVLDEPCRNRLVVPGRVAAQYRQNCGVALDLARARGGR